MFARVRVPCAMLAQGTFPRAFAVAVVFLGVPSFVSAESWVDELVREASQAAEGQGGAVIIENHSSVSTGGKVVGSGGSSVSDGDVSASSRSETYINVGSEGGEARVKVETSRNGETETREYEKKVGAGQPMHLEVSTRVDESGAEVSATTKDEHGNEESIEARLSSSTEGHSPPFMTRFESAIKSMPALFARVLGFFWAW